MLISSPASVKAKLIHAAISGYQDNRLIRVDGESSVCLTSCQVLGSSHEVT